ncbi:MAG TPA: carboxypeptidase regulatory-like domain-containing protein [Bryobacteraceae bacterium]|jgi:hypothetical protein|nr:carboxypeptidase regulatory-like domain-containing protein [Bryobacteraceae bacterium]
MRPSTRPLHVCLLTLTLALIPAAAQNASLSGTVLDSQQGAVKAAEITLVNVDTNLTFRTLSSEAGRFLLPPVPPGRYEVKAMSPGFAPYRLTGLVLEVDESKILAISLKPANVQETVNVSDAPPEVTLDRADRSLVLDQTFVESIPLNVRNPLQLINFSVAVTKGDDGLSGQNITSESRTNTWRINGAKGSTTDIQIDGATDTTAYYNQAAGIPGIDTVQEYRVFTDAYAPEFGRTSGGIVSYALKSGTNALHGSFFEFLRNSDLDSDGFNADQAGQKIAAFRRNQFGFTLGGPVVLPKIYNGRNRTFFFASYDGLRDSDAGSFTGTMPTALERTGDFSKTTDSNGKLIVIYDPSTTQLNPAAPAGTTSYIRTPFAGNIVPLSEQNALGQKMLTYYPLPNEPGVGLSSTNNYFSNAPGTDNNNLYDIRIDQILTDHQSIFGHFEHFSNNILQSNYYGNGLAPVNSNDRIPGINVMGHHTWAISPTLVFEQHASWAHSESNRTEPSGGLTASSVGFPEAVTPGQTGTMMPVVSATRISSLGNNYPFEANKSSVYQYAADLSWIKGIHTFKFGVDARHYPVQLFDPEQLAISATSNFTGGSNPNAAVADSGSGVADLLLGAAGVQSGYEPQTNSAHNYFGFYAQDAARLTRKLTVTFGLRVEYETGDVENKNQLNYVDLSSPSPIAAQVPSLHLTGGVGVPGLNGSSDSLQVPRGLAYDPRVGLAYAVDSKAVIHVGFGIFHHPAAAWQQFPNALQTTKISTSIAAQSNGVTPLFNLSNPFPSGLPTPGGNAAGLANYLGQNIAGPLHTEDFPYQNNWSFDIQRQLPSHFVVTAAYVGNTGVHLYAPIQYNQIPDADLALGSKLLNVVANPFYGVITDPSSTLSLATVQAFQLLRPYPQLLNVKALNVGAGHSSYEAGQLTVERRLAQGLAVTLGYAFSKAEDNVGEQTSVAGTMNTFQDTYCFVCDKALSDQNQKNTLRWSTRYDLPFGPGRPMLNSGFASRALGGWALGAFYTFDSGRPVAVSSPNNSNSGGGGSGERPDATGVSAALPGGPNISANGLYFNPAAFTQTPEFAFGNVSRYLGDVNSPSAWNWDMLAEKNTQIRERYHLTFRAEFFNALNHVVFSGPSTSITSSTFGHIILSQSNTPRQIQFSLRLSF